MAQIKTAVKDQVDANNAEKDIENSHNVHDIIDKVKKSVERANKGDHFSTRDP